MLVHTVDSLSANGATGARLDNANLGSLSQRFEIMMRFYDQ